MFVHHTNLEDAQADARRLICYDCGVACDLGQMREKRLEFLAGLGARAAGARRLPMADGRAEQIRLRTAGPEALRPPQPGSAPEKWRLRFEKLGVVGLLGHLDLVRELSRVVRRAGIAMAYTKGFHPKPDMSFGPALSLGVLSLDEYVDVKLIDPPESGALVSRLNRATAGGLKFLDAYPLGAGSPSLGQLIHEAVYVLGLDRHSLSELGGSAGLQRTIDEFLAQSSVTVLRNKKGIGRQVDVRRAVTRCELGHERERVILSQAGLRGALLPLRLGIRIGPAGSAKLTEVLEALTGRADFPHVALRTSLISRAPLLTATGPRSQPEVRDLSAPRLPT